MNDEILILCPDISQQRRVQRLAFDLGADPRVAADAADLLHQIQQRGSPLALVIDPGPSAPEALRLLTELRAQASPERSALLVLAQGVEVEAALRRQMAALGLASLLPSKATALSMAGPWGQALADQRAHRARLFKAAFRPPPLPKPTLPRHPAPASAPAPLADPMPDGPVDPAPPAAALPPAKGARSMARIAGLGLARGADLATDLQRLAQETAQAFGVTGAVLALALDDGPRFAAWQAALPGIRTATPAEWLECLEVLQGDLPSALQVPDAGAHPGLRGLVMVARGALGACLVAPVITADGVALGTACLMEARPRAWEAGELEQLSALARRWADEVGLAQQMRRLTQGLQDQWDEAAASGERVDALRAVLENLELGVLLHGSDGRVLIANRRLADMTGMLALQIEGGGYREFIRELDALFDDPGAIPEALREPPEGPYSLREVLATQRPRRQWLRWTARPIPWGPAWYELITVEDVTAEAELEGRLLDPASRDPLTGLPDARAARGLGLRAAEQAAQRQRPLSLLLCELDGIQGAGADRALSALASLLRMLPRPTDRAARWGRSAFVLLFPDTDEAPARRVAERLRAAVAELPEGLSLSGGLAWGAGGCSFDALLDAAERRLAVAASSGGNAIR